MKISQLTPLTLIVSASCIGQDNSKTSTTSVGKIVSRPVENSKLIKTQGSSTSDNIFCSLLDKAGNLWFGTTGEGVYRFNGKTFTQFTKADGLGSNTVYSILEDAAGNIWIGTADGACRYDGKKIVRVPIAETSFSLNNNNNYNNSQSTKNSVWSMLQDRSGKIWFGTGEGVYYYNGQSFTHFLQNDGVINQQNLHLKMIDCMVQDKSGNIWFASGCPPGGEGVCMYDGKTITGFKPNGDGWVRYIKEDKKGNLWFSGRLHGNFIYNGKTFTIFTEKVGIGNPLLIDKSGNTWFNGEEKQSGVESEGGIWRYDGKSFQNFKIQDGMSKYFVWSMLEDKNGHIWLGTRNTELYKYDGKTFTLYSE